MGNASFMQTSFLGGEWSELAQGRMTDPAYKTALNVMLNNVPLEAGACVRRPGARFLAHTKAGHPAVLRAFDFSVSQPYQLEFTQGFIRFFAGLDLLTWEAIEGPVQVSYVFAENPARIAIGVAPPAGWSNGATVVFQLPSVPASSTDLLGRQFVIANLDTGAQTFTLKDPITGLDVDGSAWVYNPSITVQDTVERVFELAAPYQTADLDAVRVVQDDDNVLILHQSYEPRIITQPDDGSVPFTIAVKPFDDGPYLDINKTTTTLALSGLSGSVTVTASSTTGINGGTGFASTDVGRLIRFQGGPAAWDAGTTYAKAAVVLGSDNNIYTSLQGGNINHDPTTDNTATYWQISPETVAWTWLRITVVGGTTSVTATILGDSPLHDTATISWQLGLYSDTTGWPASGTYHEGRLWLSGRAKAFTNRVDGSYSNDVFNFKPTADDGTVSDANGVSATFRAKEANIIYWMISTDDGLMLGTQAGEWRIKASALDDPISPTSIQARRVSTFGCADVLPEQPGGQTAFVQRQQRRLLAHTQLTANKYSASNLSQNADHLSESGFAEIAWQQEPLLCIWARRVDGTLVGCTYREREYSGYAVSKDPFNGWHRHELGFDRSVVSIQVGPAFDGLSESLYMVTNQPDEDAVDFGVHWVQVVMPVFDATVQGWGAYYTDGGGTPPYAQLYQVSNGDSFDGIRIFGLWPANSLVVVPVLGGLDLGDRTVANGSVDVPFGTDPDGKFTLAFFLAQSNGTDYGVFEVQTGYVVTTTVTPGFPANTLNAYVGPDVPAGGVVGSNGDICHVDAPNDRVFEMCASGVGLFSNGGIRNIDASSDVENAQADNYSLFGPAASLGAWDNSTTYSLDAVVTGSDTMVYRSNSGVNLGNDPVTDAGAHWEPRATDFSIGNRISLYHDNGYIYTQGGNSNTAPFFKINATTLVLDATYGVVSSSLGGSGPGHLQLAFTSMCGPVGVDGRNYFVFNGITSAFTSGYEVTLVDADGTMGWLDSQGLDEYNTTVCRGPVGGFFAAGWPHLFPDPGDIGFYQATIQDAGYAFRKIGVLVPSDIDPAWTTWSGFLGVAYDEADGNLLAFFDSSGATNKNYLAKINSGDCSVMWKILWPESGIAYTTVNALAVTRVPGQIAFLRTIGGNQNSYLVDTIAGTVSIVAINGGVTAGFQFYEPTTQSVTFQGGFVPPGTGPTMHYTGNYLPAHSDTFSGWGRLYLGADRTEKTVTTYNIPVSLGATYTSQGQILRPDYGPDAGTRNGPAFGKKRRIHWDAFAFVRSRAVSAGTEFNKLYPIKFASDGSNIVPAPTLFTGTVSDTIQSNYSFEEKIAWEITRPYPCNVSAVGGFLEGTDK